MANAAKHMEPGKNYYVINFKQEFAGTEMWDPELECEGCRMKGSYYLEEEEGGHAAHIGVCAKCCEEGMDTIFELPGPVRYIK